MNTTLQQNRLMQHACGLSNNENRNWFETTSGSSDDIEFKKLVDAGLAVQQKAPSWAIDKNMYHLTEKGKQVAAHTMPKPEKLSRGQQRYRRFLEYGEMFDSFITFCRWDAEQDWKNE